MTQPTRVETAAAIVREAGDKKAVDMMQKARGHTLELELMETSRLILAAKRNGYLKALRAMGFSWQTLADSVGLSRTQVRRLALEIEPTNDKENTSND